jgi:hypothetical protein
VATGNRAGTGRQRVIDFVIAAADTGHAGILPWWAPQHPSAVEDLMNDQTGRGFENFGRKVDEKVTQAMPRLEEEVKRVIAYLNDEVVPDIRQNSIKALRIAAEQLEKLAENFERGHRGSGGPK